MVRQLNYNEIRALHDELKLKDILATADKLPPFPDVVWKVMLLLKKMAPVSEIESVIKYDQSITARVLALSQSVYYSRRQKVSSLHDAILILGSQKLIQVVMASSVMRYYYSDAGGSNSYERDLWQHSVSTAIMAEMLGKHLKHKKVLSAYTAGLLHDIGKTVLNSYARIYLGAALNQMQERGLELLEIERKGMGIDHQELGELIARRWKFPEEVVAGIGFHHLPHKAKSYKDIAAIVYAADKIAMSMETAEEGKNIVETEEDPIFKSLRIDAAVCWELQLKLATALDEVKQFLTG